MKKRFFTILTALALCLSLLPTTAWAEGETEQIAVQANRAIETERELQATLNAGGTVTLTQDITLTNMLTITSTVTLDLNDHVLKMTDDGSVIAVQSNGNLTLTDSAA